MSLPIIPNNHFERLPDDLTRLIYRFDPTYHIHHKRVLQELTVCYNLLNIILTAHYTSTSDNPIARINSIEHRRSNYPPVSGKLMSSSIKFYGVLPIKNLFYRYFIDATTN